MHVLDSSLQDSSLRPALEFISRITDLTIGINTAVVRIPIYQPAPVLESFTLRIEDFLTYLFAGYAPRLQTIALRSGFFEPHPPLFRGLTRLELQDVTLD